MSSSLVFRHFSVPLRHWGNTWSQEYHFQLPQAVGKGRSNIFFGFKILTGSYWVSMKVSFKNCPNQKADQVDYSYMWSHVYWIGSTLASSWPIRSLISSHVTSWPITLLKSSCVTSWPIRLLNSSHVTTCLPQKQLMRRQWWQREHWTLAEPGTPVPPDHFLGMATSPNETLQWFNGER